MVVPVEGFYISNSSSLIVGIQELLRISFGLVNRDRHSCSGCSSVPAHHSVHHPVLSVPHHIRPHLRSNAASVFVDEHFEGADACAFLVELHVEVLRVLFDFCYCQVRIVQRSQVSLCYRHGGVESYCGSVSCISRSSVAVPACSSGAASPSILIR